MSNIQVSSYYRITGAHYASNEINPVIRDKIKIEHSVNEDYRRKGAIYTIVRDNSTRHVITALMPVKGLNDVYYGDYHGNTVGVYYRPQIDQIKVVLFNGHNPKYLRTRSRRVKNWIKKQRTTAR